MTTPDNSATEKPTIAERLRDKIATVQQFEQACGQTLSINVTIDEAVHAATELDRLADMNAGLLDRFEAVALRLAEAEAANEKLRGLFRELLDIAECDANTEENADVIMRAQAFARTAEKRTN